VAVSIRRGTIGDVAALAPLWAAMHAHHTALEDVPPTRPVADSWDRRRQQYAGWVESGKGTLLVAERDGALVGYAMVTIGDGPPTWDLGDVTAEIESLSVLAAERGRGVGRALLDAAHEVATQAGAAAVFVGVAHTNAGAIHLYEQEGYTPFYLLMVRR
jgi:ribosomal protein S18 acetylase RimI-like enzyme